MHFAKIFAAMAFAATALAAPASGPQADIQIESRQLTEVETAHLEARQRGDPILTLFRNGLGGQQIVNIVRGRNNCNAVRPFNALTALVTVDTTCTLFTGPNCSGRSATVRKIVSQGRDIRQIVGLGTQSVVSARCN